MGTISEKVLRSLLPKGLLWEIPDGSDYSKLISSIASVFADVKTFFDNLRAQAIPGTATEAFLLNEWVNAFGINPDLSEAEKQQLAQVLYTTVGGQDLDYFEAQLLASGFLADILDPVVIVHHASSACGGAICGAAECGGNGGNAFVYYKGYNEGITRFYRSGGSTDIPIPGNTTLTSATSSLQYRTVEAATLLAGQSYVDVKVRTVTVATGMAVMEVGEVLVLGSPISDVNSNAEVQSITYLENYSYAVISNLVEYIKPIQLTVFYIPSMDLNRDYYLAVGASGDIRKFDENAQTWDAKTSGTANELLCVHGLPDGSFIVAAGVGGTVIYSQDMGETWNALGSFPLSNTLTGCWVVSPSEVWIVGHDGAGTARAWYWDGATWTQSTSKAYGGWNGISVLSSTDIYVVSDISGTRGVWHYDGTWTNDTPDPADQIESICRDTIDQNKFYIHSNAGGGYRRLWYGSFGSWSILQVDAYSHSENLGKSIWVDESGKAWLCGSDGGSNAVVRSWDGSLSTEFSKSSSAFTGIHGRSSESILVTGIASGGTNYDTYFFDGTSWIQVQITGTAHDMRGVWAPAA